MLVSPAGAAPPGGRRGAEPAAAPEPVLVGAAGAGRDAAGPPDAVDGTGPRPVPAGCCWPAGRRSSPALTAAGITGYGVRTALGPPRPRPGADPAGQAPRAAWTASASPWSPTSTSARCAAGRTPSGSSRMINRLDADLVAVVGDLVDGSVAELGAAAAPLRDLRSRHGSFFVTGNHEYYSGYRGVDRGGRPARAAGAAQRAASRSGPGGSRPGRRQRRRPAAAASATGPDFAAALGDRDPCRPGGAARPPAGRRPHEAAAARRRPAAVRAHPRRADGAVQPGRPAASSRWSAGSARSTARQVYVTNGAGFWGPPVRVGAAAADHPGRAALAHSGRARPRVRGAVGRRGGRDRMRRASVQRRTPGGLPPFVADLHIHSKYSRACSRDLDCRTSPGGPGARASRCSAPATSPTPPGSTTCARRCVPAEPGLFRLRPERERGHRPPAAARLPAAEADPVRFMLSVEISTIYKRDDRTRKVHHLIYLPDLDAVGRFNTALGPDRQPRLRRPADPRPRLPRPAGDHAGGQPGRLPGAGAHLDAVVLRAGLEVRLRRDRRLLRRPGRAHLRGGDRPVLRPGDELAGVQPGPLPAGVQLRRALAAGAGPRGDRCSTPSWTTSRSARRCAPATAWPARSSSSPRRASTTPTGTAPAASTGRRRRPAQAGGRCPECGKPLTVGVLHRVEELADRPDGYRPAGAPGGRPT